MSDSTGSQVAQGLHRVGGGIVDYFVPGASVEIGKVENEVAAGLGGGDHFFTGTPLPKVGKPGGSAPTGGAPTTNIDPVANGRDIQENAAMRGWASLADPRMANLVSGRMADVGKAAQKEQAAALNIDVPAKSKSGGAMGLLAVAALVLL